MYRSIWTLSSFVHNGAIDRWKYLITGLAFLVAAAILTATVAVQISNRTRVPGPLVGGPLSPRLKHVLDEMSSNINPSVDPCGDFYEYACGSFRKRHPLAEGKGETSYHTIHTDRVYSTIIRRLRGDDLSSSAIAPLKYLKRVWDSCVTDDSDTDQNMKRLAGYFRQLDQSDLQSKFIKLAEDGFDVLTSVKKNRMDEYNAQLEIGPPRTGVEIGKAHLTADSDLTLDYISDLLGLMKQYTSEVTQYTPQDIVLLAYLLASALRETRRGGNSRTSVMSVKELSEKTGFAWIDLLNRNSHSVQFSNSTRVAIEDLRYLKILELQSDDEYKQLMSEYFKVMVLHKMCFFLGNECRELQFKLFSEATTVHLPHYKEKNQFIEQVCFQMLRDNFEDLIFQVYSSTQGDNVTLSFYSDLMTGLTSEFDRTLAGMSWMDDATKSKAREITRSLGRSDAIAAPGQSQVDERLEEKYRDAPFVSSSDKVDILSYFLEIMTYSRAVEFKESTGPVWPTSLFSTQPSLAHRSRRLFLPDSFVRGPFATPDLPTAIKYGFFGSILAHEMTHAFDAVADHYSQAMGSRFWSDSTQNNFQDKMKCLVDLYNREELECVPFGSLVQVSINGSFSLNGNLADLIGLHVAYNAFKSTRVARTDASELPAPLRDRSGDQLFFLSYANGYCSNQLKPTSAKEPTNKFIVNLPLSQMKEFTEAFGCRSGCRMNPREKCPFA